MRAFLMAAAGLAATAAAALAQPGPPSGAMETQATFLARCRAEYAVRYPRAKGGEGTCRDLWARAAAAGPVADIMLALAGHGPDLATVRARLVGVSWKPRPDRGDLATGRLGQWQVNLQGSAGVQTVLFSWSKVGELSPFDVVEALKVRGAQVAEVACQGFGVGEQTHAYRVDAPPRAPFGITVYDRAAPTANASSTYAVTLDLRRPPPTLAALRRAPQGAEWQAHCE